MEDVFFWLERLERLGPWAALLLYYFLRLDRQMERVNADLQEMRNATDEIRDTIKLWLQMKLQ